MKRSLHNHHQGCSSNNQAYVATRRVKVQVKYGAIQSGMRSDASSRAGRPGRPRLFENVIVASFSSSLLTKRAPLHAEEEKKRI
jgi:hypothetical protein